MNKHDLEIIEMMTKAGEGMILINQILIDIADEQKKFLEKLNGMSKDRELVLQAKQLTAERN